MAAAYGERSPGIESTSPVAARMNPRRFTGEFLLAKKGNPIACGDVRPYYVMTPC